jgi:hypothetical protein
MIGRRFSDHDNDGGRRRGQGGIQGTSLRHRSGSVDGHTSRWTWTCGCVRERAGAEWAELAGRGDGEGWGRGTRDEDALPDIVPRGGRARRVMNVTWAHPWLVQGIGHRSNAVGGDGLGSNDDEEDEDEEDGRVEERNGERNGERWKKDRNQLDSVARIFIMLKLALSWLVQVPCACRA